MVNGGGQATRRVPLDRLAGALGVALPAPLIVISLITRGQHEVVGVHGTRSARDVPSPTPLCVEVVRSARPVIVHDVRRRLAADGLLARLGISGYAAVPILVEGAAVGAVAALDRQVRPWSERDLDLLRRFADLVPAITTEGLDRRTRELEELALHDELTGLLNRRGFYAVAGGQLAVANRTGMAGGVLFIDVDGLKEVNDREGHSAGDAVLRLAADVLRATFRDSDSIGRIGGDEFVVFSIAATDRDMATLTGRLSGELARANQPRSAGLQLQWSVGAVGFDGHGAETLDGLVAEADRRMYQLKPPR